METIKRKAATVNNTHIKDYFFLHFAFIIYSFVSLLEKTASGYPFISFGFACCLSGMIAVTGLYAFLWQKVLKRFPLVVAYSNKGAAIIWTMLMGVIFFSEKITFNNIAGAVIIMAGIVLVSKND